MRLLISLSIVLGLTAPSASAQDVDISQCTQLKSSKARASCFETVATKLSEAKRAEKDFAAFVVRSKQEVSRPFIDPDSANFRSLLITQGNARKSLCGEVNGKNRYGGYVGYRRFIVSFNTLESKYLTPSLEQSTAAPAEGSLEDRLYKLKAELFNATWDTTCVSSPVVWRE